jgi:hypothetical protein
MTGLRLERGYKKDHRDNTYDLKAPMTKDLDCINLQEHRLLGRSRSGTYLFGFAQPRIESARLRVS